MTLSILQGLLQKYVRSLFDEGILNDQFNHVYTLKKTEKPDSVVNLIENYFADVDVIISKLSNHVNKSNVDFRKLADLAREIEEKSTSIGAEHVRLACVYLVQACDEKHEEKFSRSMTWIKDEFIQTRCKLEAFIQMERKIIRYMESQT